MKLLSQSRVVIDRSIFTLIAFEAGASRITGIDIFDWAIERLLQEEEIILPDHVLYLDVTPQVSAQRADENCIPTPKFLLSGEFNQGFRDFFIALSENCPGYVTIVSADRPEEEVAVSAKITIDSLAK